MKNIFQIQSLFLQWHKHQGISSIEKIRTGCSNLLRSFDLEIDHPLFRVFFPLVRKGFIEFCGNGKYQISRPTILYYKKEQIAVGINLLIKQKELLANIGKTNKDELGVIRLNTTEKNIHDFCIKSNCDYSEPNISEILSNFPKISEVVGKFNRTSISSSGEYYDVLEHRWGKDKNKCFGIFRLSEDSNKYYLRTQQADLQVPDSKTNPEGRPLAECFQARIDDYNFLIYNKTNNFLVVKNINIPILIERVLRTASLFSQSGVKKENRKTIYSKITLSTIKQINRIFGAKVTKEV